MSEIIDQKENPKREDRLHACVTYGGTLCALAGKGKGCLKQDGNRTFTQGSICLLLPALGMMNSIPDSVVLLHGAVGCGSPSHSSTANARAGGNLRWGKIKDSLWLSTAMNETDVISGGEKKLEAAIIEADTRYRPRAIFVVSTCIPGIIGDDVNGIVDKVQPQVTASIVPVHCEGFKTKIWATAYDAVYHGIGRTMLDEPDEIKRIVSDEAEEQKEKLRYSKTVNLCNVSSMGRADELELVRLLNALGLEVNVFPVFSKPEEMYKVTRAALSINVCPTHDDYFVQFLEEKYGVPYIIKHMPIGIKNTSLWVRDVAEFFGLGKQADELIKEEELLIREAVKEFRPVFDGKKAFISAGEYRALSTALLLKELGFQISAIRAYHHDEFAEVEYAKLKEENQGVDIPMNIANVQHYEEANLLKKLKPDFFMGHINGNGTASKLGIPSHVIYNTGLTYVGYRGAYDLARRIYRQLKNPAFNANLSRNTRLPYKESWYSENPFKYIKSSEAEYNE